MAFFSQGSAQWLTQEDFEHDLINRVIVSLRSDIGLKRSLGTIDEQTCKNMYQNESEKFILSFGHILEDCYLERIARDNQHIKSGIHATRILSLRQASSFRQHQHGGEEECVNIVKAISQASRNRRYQKLKQLIQKGVYFSSEQIKGRYPQLYYDHVGKLYGELSPIISKEISSNNNVNNIQCTMLGDMLSDAYQSLKEDNQVSQPSNTTVHTLSSFNVQSTFQHNEQRSDILEGSISQTLCKLDIKVEKNRSPSKEQQDISVTEIEEQRKEMVKIATERFLQGYDDEWVNYKDNIDENQDLDIDENQDTGKEDSYFDY